jgi:hypothetical protein
VLQQAPPPIVVVVVVVPLIDLLVSNHSVVLLGSPNLLLDLT